MKLLSFILLLTVFLAQDCNRKNKASLPEMETSEVMRVVKLTNNPCFGKCPVYSLTLYNNGKAEYVGQANVKRMGTYTKEIPTEQVADILMRLNAANFWEMEDRYISKLADTPKIIITQFRKDTSKIVRGDHVRPAALLEIEKTLAEIAENEEGWEKIKDHPTQDVNKLPSHFIKNEIIAKFEKGTDVEAAVESKKQFGISIKKRVAPNLDMYVLTFDTIRVNPGRMLSQVKKMPGVIEAQFNKQLAPREH
ncbi:MAG: hypothetical protein ACI8YQ_003475 [Polaribacter sp.]|jgi:hypothetical protein